MNQVIQKRINFTKVTFDVYSNGTYNTHHFVTFRKLNLTQAKQFCRQKTDLYISNTVKLEHFTRVYEINIEDFISHAKCVITVKTDSAK